MSRVILHRLLPILLFVSLPGALEAREQVLYSPSGSYAFPVAGNVQEMAWTHHHWNGGNAVDILPAPDLTPGSRAFAAFEHSTVVAVVAGTVKPATNEIGGTALLLFGNDGREYYYAHLARADVTRPTRVSAGEPIGTIGHSGRWARYLEIHLHFAITSRWRSGLDWPNDVNAAAWIEKTFGLPWIDQNPRPYGPAYPHGSPLAEPYRIAESFAQMRAANRDTASIRMEPLLRGVSEVPVYSTLTGEIRVMRATVFGLRLQVSNRHTSQTVVYSGLASAVRQTGDVVEAGQIVGWASGPLDYMYFNGGVLADPAPMLAAGVDRPGEGGAAPQAGGALDAASPPGVGPPASAAGESGAAGPVLPGSPRDGSPAAAAGATVRDLLN